MEVIDVLKIQNRFLDTQEQTKSIINAETKPQEVVEQKPETQPQAKEQEKRKKIGSYTSEKKAS